MAISPDETSYEVLLGDEVIGRSNLEYRDTSMGVAHGGFTPTLAFTKVTDVFALFAESQGDTGTVDEAKLRDYYTRRDSLGLRLRSAAGATIDTEAIHIVDFRAELDDEDACQLEVNLASHDGLDGCD